MDCVISELCFKRTILQWNYRKMTMILSFSYNSFEKFCGKNIGSHNMTVLYPYPCYTWCGIKGVHCFQMMTFFLIGSIGVNK